MKKIKYMIGILLLSALFSCNSFMDLDNFQNTPTEDAYNTVQDVKNGLNGAYYALGNSAFYGRNIVALGDMAADNANAGKAAGHFVSINQYTFAVTDQYIRDIWTAGYQVMDRTTRTIQGANRLLAEDMALSEEDMALLYSYQSQCYALRALAAHVLVNVYGLPYQTGVSNDQLGIVTMPGDMPIPVLKDVARSTVEQTYAQIFTDIAAAKSAQKMVDEFNAVQYSATDQVTWDQFYLQTAGLYALEARVALFTGDYSGAVNAADSAILLRNSADVSNEQYLKMWQSVAINDEDIFTIAKSEKDNLSANSLNVLYGSYGGTVTDTLVNIFASTDIRLQLITSGLHPKKFDGISTNRSVSNIPVFRKSEMYLILAEAYALSGDEASGRTALLRVAQRDAAVTSAVLDALSGDDLLAFIAAERRRELFQEGFRWYDTRRTGEIIKVANGISEPFDIAKFVYPIPAGEINSGFGVVQNDNWQMNMPVFP